MKRVIYTVIVGGYDRLIEPQPFPGWDFVCFTDGRNTGLRATVGLIDWYGSTFDTKDMEQFRQSRLIKIFPHR